MHNQIIDYVIYGDVSPHAPDPLNLWPPFGLVDTAEAATVLGVALTLNYEQMEKPIPPVCIPLNFNQGTEPSRCVYQLNTPDTSFFRNKSYLKQILHLFQKRSSNIFGI